MPAERTTMRHVREVLRLKFVGGVPTREIARRIGVAASTVRATLKRFQASGLSWPLPEEMTDAALEERLFANAGTKQGHRRLIEPDWTAIHRELKRKHVMLSILWDEYIEREPQGYRYSRYVAASFMLCKELYLRGLLNSRALFTQHNQMWVANLCPTEARYGSDDLFRPLDPR
jgi:transposase-like protein